MKVLLTGFKPFNGGDINPSFEVVKEIQSHNYPNLEIKSIELLVEYHHDGDKVIEAIQNFKPDLVLMCGLAGGRKNVTFEYMAVNVDSASIPDNKGELIDFSEIELNRPLALKTSVDVKSLKEKLSDQPFSISFHAGTYICNEIYYRALSYIEQNNLPIKCGFVHFPFLEEQSKDHRYPFLSLEKMVEVMEKIICHIKETK